MYNEFNAFKFMVISNYMETFYTNHLRDDGLTFSQSRVIGLLHDKSCNGLMPQKELEKSLCISQPALTGLLKRLEAKELVTIEVDENDRRSRNIRLSEKAMKYPDIIHKVQRELDEATLYDLTKDEDRELRILIDKIYATIYREMNEE